VSDWAACCGTTTAALPDSLPDFHDDLPLNSCGTSLVEALSSLALCRLTNQAATISSLTYCLMQTNSTGNLVDSIPGPARLQAFARRLNFLTIRHLKNSSMPLST
jgi:hypothetical protein